MDGVELRQLRCLVAVVDEGSFTDAAIALGVSQAAASRTVQALERALGVRLLHRTSRVVHPTAAGVRVLARARVLLRGVDELVAEAAGGQARLRVGHAWSAFGARTAEFLRRWRAAHPEVELDLVRHNSPTAGLAEGRCDLAVVRAEVDRDRWAHALVGYEDRVLAVATDDPWARRRSVGLAEVAGRTVAVDRRTGTTTLRLWQADRRPATEDTADVDDWLAAIATGRCVGVTPRATAAQYRRDGITYRPLRGAPPVPVHLIWRPGDANAALHAVAALLVELYREPTSARPHS
ncbi:LysR family transcriptional regulator [Actinokineospora bangkokensis]|uniref:LysR family transcriptional regulator n=1 Tax=Actinokineospora bangkokensis TaxID=1193682 RepID=A0A1Q9LK14_9PSEU|nr:LysR family transcriptional regulator [Actinokineospora bangkokensis]OLR92343.1 LysR family transcriptional regulator [Actinokineospora bangkokensis]